MDLAFGLYELKHSSAVIIQLFHAVVLSDILVCLSSFYYFQPAHGRLVFLINFSTIVKNTLKRGVRGPNSLIMFLRLLMSRFSKTPINGTRRE